MLTIRYYSTFKKDYKRIVKRGYDVRKLNEVIDLLANEKKLTDNFKDHPLTGNYLGFRECNITTDWLLIYEITNKDLVLFLTRTGTHSDLFT